MCLATGILVSNQFTVERLGKNYRTAYYFMGAIDIIILLLFKFIYPIIPCEEIIKDKEIISEEHLINKLT